MSTDLSAVLLAVGIFMLGVLSPGPNFLVVSERSMASGFRAGVATGLGVALGDGAYAAAGLLGLAPLISGGGRVFAGVKLLGGLYIAWIGARMLWRSQRAARVAGQPGDASVGLGRCFRIGLLTDLANPKTVVFFASIFATAYDPSLSARTLVAMWAGIVLSSILWRAGLAAAFSRGRVRALYRHFRAWVEAAFGSALVLLGARMAVEGRPR